MDELSVKLIRTDGGTQPRAQLNQAIIQEYAEEIQRGIEFPPIIVYFDSQNYWLTDGFHRLAATKLAGQSMIKADIRVGQLRDAILFSVGVNAAHGLRRTNADKHRAVEIMLRDQEWSQWSDREIARRCAVSDRFVNNVRKEFLAQPTKASAQASIQRRKVIRNGKVYTVNTANIGRSKMRSRQPSYSTPTSSFSTEKSNNNHKNINAPNHEVLKDKKNSNKASPKVKVECLDCTHSNTEELQPEVFLIKSPSLQAEIKCSPSMMIDLLNHLRDYPAFVEALLKQIAFCKEASPF